MPFSHSLIVHVRAMQQSLRKVDGRARLDPASLKLEVRARGKRVELLPQFTLIRNGARIYTPRMSAEVRGFLGWRPYFNKVWPVAIDKSAFKDYCRLHGLRTPKQFRDASTVDTNVIIKKSRSSFGQGIIGPLAPEKLRQSVYTLADGEYFEQFIPGQIGKFWFWNDRLTVVELFPMIEIVGDGRCTIQQLIEAQKGDYVAQHLTHEWDAWKGMLNFQGLDLDSILPSGKTAVIDFRYQSTLRPSEFKNKNSIASHRSTTIVEQLEHAGRLFWNAIPEATRPNTAYTIDAIVDAHQKIWFLEMNCNPLMHVDVYPSMIECLFEAGANSDAGAMGNLVLRAEADVQMDKRSATIY